MPRYDMTLASYRETRALELALAGCGWDQVAKDLGYANRSGAWKAAQRGLSKRTELAADMYRSRSLVDLDLLQERSWGRAMRGDLRAVSVALRAIDQRSRLLGL